MLPGFRFLLAAIVLSMSIVIFGLGAAALLRAAHEEVASVPNRRVMAEPVFAQPVEAPQLALLRVEPAVPEKAPDAPPAVTLPQEPEPEAAPVPKADTEKLAALKLDDVAPGEAAKPEAEAKPEVAAKPETEAMETPVVVPPAAEPFPSTGTKIAALETAPSPPAEAAPAPPDVLVPPAMNEPSTAANIAANKTAALSGPDAKVEKPAEAKKAAEKPDPGEIKKQQRAERAKERRRLAARRAKLAAQQAAAAQLAANPFPPIIQPLQPAQPAAATTTRRRKTQAAN
jgi:hypothetical protein